MHERPFSLILSDLGSLLSLMLFLCAGDPESDDNRTIPSPYTIRFPRLENIPGG